jgi:N utilization substance protein A
VASSKVKFTERELRFISLFQEYTGATVKDCVEDENLLVFVVDHGELGQAVGKKGLKVKELSSIFQKRLKIIEYSDDVAAFIANALKPANVKQVRVLEKADGAKIAIAEVDPNDKGMTIGKGGKNIDLIKQIVKRHHGIEKIVIQ